MSSKFVLKVRRESCKEVEKILFMSMVDRERVFSIFWRFNLNGDDESSYFLVAGLRQSCRRILGVAKKNMERNNISVKIFNYDSIRTLELDSLVLNGGENIAGKIIANYSNTMYKRYYSKLTTQFVLKNKLSSSYVFCSNCSEGFGEPVELNSLVGTYKCSCCNHAMEVSGPLITNKVPVPHLSEEEKQRIINGYDVVLFEEGCTPSPNSYRPGEQISMLSSSESEPPIARQSGRRRKRFFIIESYVKIDALQLCLEL